LFGGINFAEEIVYNDLYILNTDTWEWSYVGEKGEEIHERNSHSLDILDYGESDGKYLFLYGGASPERGVFKDAFYARLPDTDDEIVSDMKSFHVEWRKLNDDAGNMIYESERPGNREMHGTCVVGGKQLFLIGGRNEQGIMFHDAWKLTKESSIDSSATNNLFIWGRVDFLELPFKCCAHTLNATLGTDGMEHLCLFGGFQERDGNVGISNELFSCPILPSSSGWQQVLCEDSESLPSRRFGHCSTELCASDDNSKPAAIVIFGGVKEDEDLSDVWIIGTHAASP
tara:strand:+ start:522 stop:1379 length:858 start_codon:yes stop_codon:yes gene_type:complete